MLCVYSYTNRGQQRNIQNIHVWGTRNIIIGVETYKSVDPFSIYFHICTVKRISTCTQNVQRPSCTTFLQYPRVHIPYMHYIHGHLQKKIFIHMYYLHHHLLEWWLSR